MTRARWAGLAAVLLLALAALWYFASPAWTLHRMQAAAKAGDGDALVAMIDFPALREDLKTDAMAGIMRETRDDDSAGVGAALGAMFVGPMVDTLVSPAAVRAALIARPDSAATDRADRSLPSLRVPERPVVVRRGLSEFLVASEDDRTAGLVFRRDGLGWKLAGVDLPADPAR